MSCKFEICFVLVFNCFVRMIVFTLIYKHAIDIDVDIGMGMGMGIGMGMGM